MTKEQEVIKYIETRIKICNENADICDDNDFDEEATYLREESYMLETVLNMLKEKDAEIEKKDKIIDLMAERIEWLCKSNGILLDREHDENFIQEDIKQYFERKSEE